MNNYAYGIVSVENSRNWVLLFDANCVILNRIEKITLADFCYGAGDFYNFQCSRKLRQVEEKTKWR